MSIQELFKLIEQWAIDRGLDKNGTVEGQLIKTAEEVVELIIAISKNNVNDIRDAIGDVFVTLVIGNLIENNKGFNEVLDNFVTTKIVYPSKINIISDLLSITGDLVRGRTYIEEYYYILSCLPFVAEYYNLDFTNCIETAYKEIADRKGVVRDGTFIKEDDLIWSVN